MAPETTVPQVVELERAYDAAGRRASETSAQPFDKRPMAYGAIVAIIIILIFGGIGVYLFLHPEVAAVVRDIFIIFLGLGAFIIILLLIVLVVITAYLVLKINDLIHLLDREIKPMLADLQRTLGTVRGTATFLSEQAVKPVISTAATVAAVRATVSALFRRN
jgi:hypothetical protein